MEAMDADSVAGAEGRSARSCVACAKAKAKCARQQGHESCERCARLKKECHARESAQRRRKPIKATRSAQLEKLENKLESLVYALSKPEAQQRLGAITQPSDPTPCSPAEARAIAIKHSDIRAEEVFNAACSRGDDESIESAAITALPSAKSSQANAMALIDQVVSALVSFSSQQKDQFGRLSQLDDIGGLLQLEHSGKPGFARDDARAQKLVECVKAAVGQFTASNDPLELGVTVTEADLLLDRYRRLMAPGFPFVPIPSDMTASQLYQEKPCFLRAIVTVASFHDGPRQQELAKTMMRDISERALINGEKTMDVLQGILVLVAWYHPYAAANQATNLLHLAVALIIDLGIDRIPSACEKHKMETAATRDVHGHATALRVPTQEERRALAGTFYLISTLSSSFKKLDAMKYTRWLDDCMTALESAQEYKSDLHLVQMVRIQKVIEEINTTETQGAPAQLFVKAYLNELARLRKADTCLDKFNVYLQLQHSAAEVLAWELSFAGIQDNNNSSRIAAQDCLSGLYSCVQAIKSFVEVYFSIPASQYLTLPFSVFAQFAHAFMALLKMASLEVDGWDLKTLHQELSFAALVEEAAQRFDQVTDLTPDDVALNNDCFTKWAQKVRWMKHFYEAKFVQDEPAAPVKAAGDACVKQAQYDTPLAPAQQQPTPPDDVLAGDFFGYLDESFWNNWPADFDFGFTEQALSHLG